MVITFSEVKLHHLASQWFEKAGFFAEAIQHSLTASDWERAGGLIDDQSASLLGRGEMITLLGWLKSMPEYEIRARPNLCLVYGWALILTGQFDAAEPFLDCAERLSHIPHLKNRINSIFGPENRVK
jgi:LuxR family maltose regulon positive regulatory protein